MKKLCVIVCLVFGNAFGSALTPEEAGLTLTDLAGIEQDLVDSLCPPESLESKVSYLSSMNELEIKGNSRTGGRYFCSTKAFNLEELYPEIGHIFYCGYYTDWNDDLVRSAHIIACPPEETTSE